MKRVFLFAAASAFAFHVFAADETKQPVSVNGGLDLIHYANVLQQTSTKATQVYSVSISPNMAVVFEKAWLTGSAAVRGELINNYASVEKANFGRSKYTINPTLDLSADLGNGLGLWASEFFNVDIYRDREYAGKNELDNMTWIGPKYKFSFGPEVKVSFVNAAIILPNGIGLSEIGSARFALPKGRAAIDTSTSSSLDMLGGQAEVSHQFATRTTAAATYRYLTTASSTDSEDDGLYEHRVRVDLGQKLNSRVNLGMAYRYTRDDYPNKPAVDVWEQHRFKPSVEVLVNAVKLGAYYQLDWESTSVSSANTLKHEVSTGVGLTF